MLARPYRLPATFRLNHPKNIYSPLFTLKYAPSALSHSRCLIIISKAVDKRATKRNELRRTFLSFLQAKQQLMSNPYDLLFILKKDVISSSIQQITQEIDVSIGKIPLL